MVKRRHKRFFAFAFLFITMLMKANAQSDDLKIADQYFAKADYEKAVSYYQKVFKKGNDNLNTYYESFLLSQKRLRAYKELDKWLPRLIKKEPTNTQYHVDYVLNLRDLGETKKYEDQLSELIDDYKLSELTTRKLTSALIKRVEYKSAINVFLVSREYLQTEQLYALDLATIYKRQGQTEKMIDELLIVVMHNTNEREYVENFLQSSLSSNADYDLLQKKLFELVGKNADKIVLNELLVWYYLQQDDFYNAFMESKAIDKRNPSKQGQDLMKLGDLATANLEYEVAIDIYAYLSTAYPGTRTYILAQQKLIRTKEIKLEQTYPIDTLAVKGLLADYDDLLTKSTRQNDQVDIKRRQALLKAQYLHEYREAIAILDELINVRGINRTKLAQIKIDKGDIHLLTNEPWESTLLYYQAEKLMEDSPLGHEAKLRNAQLSYYKGDFELAKEHLDILKLATSRDISNDAIKLSLLIKDNLNLDTSTTALSMYAKAELYQFQKNDAKAIEILDNLLIQFPNHSLSDEIYLKQAEIYRKRGQYEQSTTALQNLLLSWKDDILGDDATFMLAEIYEKNLNNTQKAQEYYKMVLIDYPGSIFTVEARKRYRLLRGDKI